MAGCDPRRRAGIGLVAARFAVTCLAGALGVATLAPAAGHAQTAPDLERAKDLYLSGEAAMKDSRFDDAARDYGASYELSQDPALFYKIGHANERAGKCDIALIYYARYLREGKPSDPFVALTHEHIKACGGAPPGAGSNEPAAGSAAPPSGEAGPGSGSAAASHAGPEAAGAAAASQAGAETTGTAAAASPAPAVVPPDREKVAWLLGGGAIAFATLGGVLAYAASSSENDVRDLYAGLAGQTPAFDATTRKRYDEIGRAHV